MWSHPQIAGYETLLFRPEIVHFFPVDSCQFPMLSGRNRPEIIGKISA
jgi:hypothetical protein